MYELAYDDDAVVVVVVADVVVGNVDARVTSRHPPWEQRTRSRLRLPAASKRWSAESISLCVF